MPKSKKIFSIIVPCHDSVHYLYSCYESLVMQTIGMEKLDIIFVDDASADATFFLLCEMEKHFPDSITVIRLDENLRQGGARNAALPYVRGEYISFLDSDDRVDAAMYEKLEKVIDAYHPDIIKISHDIVTENGICMKEIRQDISGLFRVEKEEERRAALMHELLDYGCWNKIYRSDLVRRTASSFAEHVVYEEPKFTYPLYFFMDSFYLLDEVLYHYTFNRQGTMQKEMRMQGKVYDHAEVQRQTCEFLKERLSSDVWNTYRKEIEAYFVKSYFCETVMFAHQAGYEIDADRLEEMAAWIRSEFPLYKENIYIREWFSEDHKSALALMDQASSRSEKERNAAVSIIMPVYNEKDQIKKRMDHILEQVFSDYEIIVVDDCSEDGSYEYVLEQYGELDHLLYIRNDRKIGKAASFNVGLLNAKGKYVAFYGKNGEWTPDKLEDQWTTAQNENARVVYSPFGFTKDGKQKEMPGKDWTYQRKKGNIFPELLLNQSTVLDTMLVQRDLLIAIGGFDEGLEELWDYEMTVRLAAESPFAFTEGVRVIGKEGVRYGMENSRGGIAGQCYIMGRYCEELGRLSLKKLKFEKVLKLAEKGGNVKFYFEKLIQESGDKEYIEYIRRYLTQDISGSVRERVETDNIAGVKKCTGCLSCYNACPYGAIEKEYDGEGFIRPVVREDRCRHCKKCILACPVCTECESYLTPEKCYAVMAGDQWRIKGSSGGMFPYMASVFLEQGGYAAGAVFDEDFRVKHIVTNRQDELEKIYTSKYVQSDPGEVYKEIRVLLEKNEKVLFSGCACQIAGLKKYLSKEYENLFLVDVVCHGVPSPAVFGKYIHEIEDEEGAVKEISFRNKEKMGWKTGFYARLEDGREILRSVEDDLFLSGYLANWFLRECCYECRFKEHRYGDITLGDFWGINRLTEFDDGQGTSLVIVNSPKGEMIFDGLLKDTKKAVITYTENAISFNPCISHSVKKMRLRDLFFAEIWNRSFHDAVRHILEKQKYDVGLVCWWSQNYGNALTNYALYKTVQKLGKKVLVLDNCGPQQPLEQFREFADASYECSSDIFGDNSIGFVNMCCDTFLVGSDQVWNWSARYKNYFQLDFVEDGKRKIAYGSSFGNADGAMPAETGRPLYQRFHAIGVREESGAKVCMEKYHVPATVVMDPVFLPGKEEYRELAGQSLICEEEPYILSYFLNPTEEKRQLCTRIRDRMGVMKVIHIIDADPLFREDSMAVLQYDNVKYELKVEDFLYYFMNCRYAVTDSYHGLCFSLIFQKPFIALKNRESERFDTFSRYKQLQNRIISPGQTIDMDEVMHEPDYREIGKRLEENREVSEKWLRKQLDG